MALIRDFDRLLIKLFNPPPPRKAVEEHINVLLEPDRFNRTFVFWIRMFRHEFRMSFITEADLERLHEKFLPHMERTFDDMLPHVSRFPLIAENAIELIEVVTRTFPDYQLSKKYRDALIKGKLSAPSIVEWQKEIAKLNPTLA